jgi:hypothetical protein
MEGCDESPMEGSLIKIAVFPLLALMGLSACSPKTRTDAQLQSAAQHAVESKLQTQATFSLMEVVAAQDIACGHVMATAAPGIGNVDQDFVYRSGKLLMDTDPDFDAAAVACDVAAGAGNASDAENMISN